MKVEMESTDKLSRINIEKKLNKFGLSLPDPPKPQAAYIPYQVSGDLVYISGTLPVQDGKLIYEGALGRDLDLDKGIMAAKIALVNSLATVFDALQNIRSGSDFKALEKIVQMTGYVNSDPSFSRQHLVLNGASELLYGLFGDKGKHSRVAIGCSSLPLNAPLEISLIIQYNK